MLGFRVLRASDVILVIERVHVIAGLWGFDESSPGYLRREDSGSFLYPLLHHVSF